MASCTPAESSNGIVVTAPTRVTTIGCLQPDLCECTPLVGGTRALESGTSVSLAIALGTGGTALKTFGPAWAVGEVIGTDLLITGTAPAGKHTMVFEVTNECSEACIVLDLTVTQPCINPGTITKNVTYIATDFSVEQNIPIQDGSTIKAESVGGLTAQVYGATLNLTGKLSYPYATSYSVTLSSPCGDYTVSGQLTACQPPVVESINGISVFEKGVSANISWVLSGSGQFTMGSVTGMPAGMTAQVQNDTPSPGRATVVVQGTPVDNPCPASSCEVSIPLQAACGSVILKRKYTQQPCRALKVVSETGSKVFEYGVAGSYCKVVEGYTPVTMDEFADIPQGLSISIAPGPASNQYTVCLSGTPEKDSCTDYSKEICECATAKVSNICGFKDLEFCYSLKAAPPPRPVYCIAVFTVEAITSPNGATNRRVTVWGALGNTAATLEPSANVRASATANSNIALQVPLDVEGYGTLDFYQDTSVSGCVLLSHPTCGLVEKKPVESNCIVIDPVDPGP
jgi:hypothetical protein